MDIEKWKLKVIVIFFNLTYNKPPGRMIGISYLVRNHSSPIWLTDRGFLMNIFIGKIRFKITLLKLEIVCHIGFHVRNSCFSSWKILPQ